jgi:hypothetical protein
MQWYHYLGWMLVGMFILFFGVEMFAGMDGSQAIIPILLRIDTLKRKLLENQ